MLSRNKTVAACKGLALFLGRFLRKPQDRLSGFEVNHWDSVESGTIANTNDSASEETATLTGMALE